jgi:hypothetical protein
LSVEVVAAERVDVGVRDRCDAGDGVVGKADHVHLGAIAK